MNLIASEFDCLIAARLAAMREMRGLTQKELADRCNFLPVSISLFECARRSPSLRNLLKLCNGLRCTPNDILLPPLEALRYEPLIRDRYCEKCKTSRSGCGCPR